MFYKGVKKLIAVTIITIAMISTSTKVNASVIKSTTTISDKTVKEFSYYYNVLPVKLRTLFEVDGGNLVIYPEKQEVSGVIDSGWNSPGTLTGYYDASNIPTIYLNEKIIVRKKNFYPATAQRIVAHEFGHYVHTKVNETLYGSKSYYITEEFNQAYVLEIGNFVNIKDMSEGLKQSFSRISSPDEFYANIFAGLILSPKETKKIYPISSSLVEKDIALLQ